MAVALRRALAGALVKGPGRPWTSWIDAPRHDPKRTMSLTEMGGAVDHEAIKAARRLEVPDFPPRRPGQSLMDWIASLSSVARATRKVS